MSATGDALRNIAQQVDTDVAQYTSMLAAKNTEIAALKQQIADLTKPAPAPEPVPEPPAPTPPKTGTVFSIDISSLGSDANLTEAAKIANHKKLFGVDNLQNVRVFFGGSQPSWSNARIQALTEKDSMLISFTRYDEAAFRAFLAATPAKFRMRKGQVKICYKHEFEAEWRDAADQPAWVRDYLVKNARIAKALDESPFETQSRDDVVRIYLWYSQMQDSRTKGKWQQFVANQDFGMMGMDCYHYQVWLNNGRYATPQELFGVLVEMGQQTGLPTCVPEWGGELATGDANGTKLAKAITDGAAFIRANNVSFANWWCAAGSKDAATGLPRNHHLEQTPATVAAFKALLTA